MKKAVKPSIDCLGLGIMPMDLLFGVDIFPKPGSKIDGNSLTIQGGGPVPNVMVGLSRLGCKTALISAVADDLIGQSGIAQLKTERVDTRFLVLKKGTSDTACGLIEKGTGRRTMVLNRKIHVEPTDLDLAGLPSPRAIHLDGRDLAACMKLAKWGKENGASICFDIGSMRNDVSAIFKWIDHLVVADEYAFGFTGCRTARGAIKKLKNLCPGTVVVTEGIKGSTGLEDGNFISVPAFKVKNVDTTGAGDAYHTGYIWGLLNEYSLEKRMLYGAAIAAIKCTGPGTRTSLPVLKQVEKFLKGKPVCYD